MLLGMLISLVGASFTYELRLELIHFKAYNPNEGLALEGATFFGRLE